MKTSEEYGQAMARLCDDSFYFDQTAAEELIKQIQLNAYKAGGLSAADLKPDMVQEKCYGETESAFGQGYNAGTAAHCSVITTYFNNLKELP